MLAVQEFKEAAFYPESESEESSTEESENDGEKAKKKKKKVTYTMDSDHRLLLKNAKPLLQSHNSAVRSRRAIYYRVISLCRL